MLLLSYPTIQQLKKSGIFVTLLVMGVVGTILVLHIGSQPLIVNAQSNLIGSQNTSSQPSQSDGTLNQLEVLDEQAQDARISQLNEKGLRDLIQELETEQITLQKDILILEQKQEELRNNLNKFYQLRDARDNQTSDTVIQNLDSEITETEKELATTQTELIKKNSKETANQYTIDLAQKRLEALAVKVEDNVKTLQNQLIEFFSRYSFYFGLILIYIALFQLITIAVDKFVTSEVAQDIIKFITTALLVLAIIITLLVAFVGNLSYLLTGLGVISAALVVALQDFVSSAFAFFWVKFRNIYKNRDVIDINTGSTGMVTGVVTNVGIFRTTLKELYGNGDLNSERSTGRTVSVPNNVILKVPVVNYTQDNRILWHNTEIVITFESNFELAKTQLKAILKKQFEYALDHKDSLLDDVYNLEYVYEPKVFMSISSNGPKFSIWFAARYGHYREVQESLSAAILQAFRVHGIDLAYTTTRIISTPKEPGDTSTIAFHDTSFLNT